MPAQIGSMLLSAAIFGFFGFYFVGWAHEWTVDDERVWLVTTLKWTVRGGALLFLLSAGIAWLNAWWGNLVFSLVGLAVAAALIGVAVWDMNSNYSAGISIVLLVILAAWNGYHSWAGLRECMATRAEPQAVRP